MFIRNLILAAITIGTYMNANAQDSYKVLKLSELNEIRKQKDALVESDYIQEDNSAFVTIFKDGTSIISPPVLGGEEGIYFQDKKSMEQMVSTGVYPVKGTGSFWEREKVKVLALEEEMPYFLEQLSKAIGFKVLVNQDKAYLKEMSDVVTKALRSKPKNRRDLQLLVALFVGEVIRTKEKAVWKLFPVPSLNMSYEPEIVKGTISCSPYSYVIGQLEMAAFLPVDLQKLIEEAAQFFPTGNRRYFRPS